MPCSPVPEEPRSAHGYSGAIDNIPTLPQTTGDQSLARRTGRIIRACTAFHRYTSPNTVSLHVLTALACCASWRLLCVTYAMIARQGRSRCCLSIRLGQRRPHTLRIASDHGKRACASLLRPTPARDYGG